MSSVFSIVLTPCAAQTLANIPDRRIRTKLKERIDSLSQAPDQQGKALIGELSGYRSLRAVGQRYRVLYRLAHDVVQVVVVCVGLRQDGSRKDVYALAKRLIRLGLIEPSP